MVSYSATDTNGNTVNINNGDKITAIGGRSCTLYINEVQPHAQGMYPKPKILTSVDITISPFSQIHATTLEPVYGTSYTVKGQPVAPKSAQRWSKNQGADAPEAKECVYFNNADSTKDYGVFKAEAGDSLSSEFYSALFTVRGITLAVSSANNDWGNPGTETSTPTNIAHLMLSLNDEYEQVGNTKVKRGDGKLIISRSVLTRAEIEAFSYFEITPKGGSALKYSIWDGGIIEEQSYHWCIYLKRLR